MNTLQIVNRFCGFNGFLPTKLYTDNNWTIVKYAKGEFKEYADLLVRVHNSNVFRKNNIKIKIDSNKRQMMFSPKGYRG